MDPVTLQYMHVVPVTLQYMSVDPVTLQYMYVVPVTLIMNNVIFVKVKVKLTPEQATKAQRGNRGIALLSNFGARWGVGGQRHAPAALPPGKTQYHCIGG